MDPKLGAEKAIELYLYDRAVSTPTTAEVDAICAKFSLRQKTYLDRFSTAELYIA